LEQDAAQSVAALIDHEVTIALLPARFGISVETRLRYAEIETGERLRHSHHQPDLQAKNRI
jgi:hypothetical protein